VTKRLFTMAALAAAFAGLLLYVKFYESGPTKKERQDEAKKPAILKAKAADFQSVAIVGGNGVISMEKATDGLWRMKAPMSARGDMIAMEAITNALSNFRAESAAPEKNPDLKVFGLDNPQLGIIATLKSGKKITLKVGGKTPVGGNYYVMRDGNPAVYIVSDANISPFRKTAQELRDRSVLETFRRGDVAAVIVRAGARETVCMHTPTAKKEKKKEKQSPEWRFKDRENVDCENEADSLLSDVELTEGKEFIDKPSGNLADYGLDNPRYTLEVQLKKGGSQQLDVGNTSGASVYVRNARRNEIYQIEPALLQSLDEFRKAAAKVSDEAMKR